MSELKTASPALMFASAFNVSPLLPDGSGFLAMKLPDEGPHFYLVDWEGWEYELKFERNVESLILLMGDKQKTDQEKSESLFPFAQGTWQGKTLQIPTPKGIASWDLDAKRVSLQPLPQKQKDLYAQVAVIDRADPSWFTYQVEHFPSTSMSVHCRMRNKKGDLRIELVDQKQNRRRLLLEGSILPSLLDRPLSLSPDGKSILVSIQQEGEHRIHVIRHDGTHVADIQTGSTNKD